MNALGTSAQRIASHVKHWTSRLTDLTKRNRLLFFKPSKSTTLQMNGDLTDIYSQLAKDRQVSTDMLGLVVAEEKEADLFGKPVSNVQDARSRLRAIRAKAMEFEEERGIDALFAVFGMIEWPSDDDRPHIAPLILLPVHLLEKARGKFSLERGGDAVVNPVLTLALKETTAVDLERFEFLANIDVDGDGSVTLEDEFVLAERALAGIKGAHLRREAHLGIFSYQKMVMVKDIEKSQGEIAGHPILAALTGDTDAIRSLKAAAEPLDPRTLDDIPVEAQFQIRDSDASQAAVIERAKRGASLVVQGPPGTGKSQTIANLIAELIAAGKRVLFVAEKRAALEVVLDRLSKAGLAHLCFDLHSSHIKKRDVASRLRESLGRLSNTPPVPQADSMLRRLEDARKRLVGFARALHRVRAPLDQSLFQIRATLIDHPPDSRVECRLRGRALLAFDAVRREKTLATLGELAKVGAVFTGRQETVWRDARIEEAGAARAIRDEAVDVLSLILPNLEKTAATLAKEIGVAVPTTADGIGKLGELLAILKATRPVPKGWLTPDGLRAAQQSAGEFREAITSLRQDRETLFSHYDPAILDDSALEGVAMRFRGRATGSLSRAFYRLFSASCKRDRAFLLGYRKKPTDLADLRREAILAADVAVRTRGLAPQPPLGQFDLGLDTDLEAMEAALAWASRLVTWFVGRSLAGSRLESVISSGTWRGDRTNCDALAREASKLRTFLESLARVWPGKAWASTPFETLKATLRAVDSELPLLHELLTARRCHAELRDLGLGTFLDEVVRKGLTPERWRDALLFLWLASSHEHILDEDQALATFHGEAHQRISEEFKALDKQLFSMNCDRLSRLHAERAIAALNAYPDEEAHIRRVANKSRNIPPLREVLRDAPHALTALRPCWMMSPLSVSQFCGGAASKFDVVVFDEASQLLPEDCVPAILRAGQAIVVGDTCQLPPTTFFASVESDSLDSDEEVVEDVGGFESILEECQAFLTAEYLRWHYRSRDERLIAFSNVKFYDQRLTTFPSPDDTGEIGIRHVLVANAVYVPGREQSNAAEVQRVVDLILEHASHRPHESLGVVAFGTKHQERIRMELDRRLDADPSLSDFFSADKAEPFFVKNLETVQGDERDAIILSVGFGKDAAGRLSHNFGPINPKGGERRLNVAISRARIRMTVVSSFTHHDVDPSKSSSVGVQRLREYLEYAAARGSVLPGSYSPEAVPLNGFERDIHDCLAARGVEMCPQYGCSGYRIDLAVKHPRQKGRFVLAIECDGASYHSGATARDRDRLRQSVLEGLGWRFHRIWSTDWFRDKVAETGKALSAIERAVQESDGSTPTPSRDDPPVDPPVIEFIPGARGPRPRIPLGGPIDSYSDGDLETLLAYVRSDGKLRTESQEREEMIALLGFSRRGPRIVERLTDVIRRSSR